MLRIGYYLMKNWRLSNCGRSTEIELTKWQVRKSLTFYVKSIWLFEILKNCHILTILVFEIEQIHENNDLDFLKLPQ